MSALNKWITSFSGNATAAIPATFATSTATRVAEIAEVASTSKLSIHHVFSDEEFFTFTERAAIMQYDGGLSEKDALAGALAEIINKRSKINNK